MPCLLTDQIFANSFWKGSPKEHFYEIISKSDKGFQRRRILKHFSEVHTVQKATPHGHQSNIPVKLFQNRTRGFREEDFLRISSCPYSTKSLPHPWPPWSKFCKQFLKRVTQGIILWNYFKIWHMVSEEKNFEESLSSLHSGKKAPPWQPCFSMDQNFANSFWKGSHKEQSCEITSKSEEWFQRRRFLKNSLKNSIWLPWQPEILMESNPANTF